MLRKSLTTVITKPSRIILLLGTALAISLAGNIHNYRQWKGARHRTQQIAATTNEGSARIQKKYRGIGGSLHTVIKEITVQNEAEKSLSVGTAYLDTVTRALKIASTQIDELTKINGQITGRVKLLEIIAHKTDSPTVSRLNTLKTYEDRYLQAAYNNDTDSLILNYNVDLTAIKYHKRKNRFSPLQYYLDVYSDDPRVSINRIKRFSTQIIPRLKRFGFGPQVSLIYNQQAGRLQVSGGIGFQYNLIRF